MTYLHSMQAETDGIRAILPAKWRSLDGIVGVHWEAEAQAGASGYYLSPDPRIVFFFNDVSSQIRVADRENQLGRNDRGMARAIYVPAGVPMWTRFSARHRFSHLDLHLHQDRLMRYLAPSLGASKARSTIKRPVEVQDVGPVAALSRLVVDELSTDTRHPLFAESLVGSIATALLDIPRDDEAIQSGRLTQAQMNRLTSHLATHGDQRITVAEMAEVVGLSESWFATVFRETTGKTPLQWQLSRRIDAAQDLLCNGSLTIADIAAQLGFSDQAHLTKVFRQVVGETPAAWRRSRVQS
ncbi:AraC family transcriptional regulator [Rhizobium sp. AAP43]|uniref:helix-turn-helix domain-containing protein n=1 Tax=Rhizobium sp. AAP43 TaxID=1523420 RepID=UPI000A8FCB0B|nr:AraC family transcriptional regulator [Rhizobium sp. AAP43]